MELLAAQACEGGWKGESVDVVMAIRHPITAGIMSVFCGTKLKLKFAQQ